MKQIGIFTAAALFLFGCAPDASLPTAGGHTHRVADADATNLIAMATPSVTNLVDLPLEEAIAILDKEGKAEYLAAYDAIETRRDGVVTRIRELQEGTPEDKQHLLEQEIAELLADFRKFEKSQQHELERITTMHKARLAALRQLKTGAAEQSDREATSTTAPSAVPEASHP